VPLEHHLYLLIAEHLKTNPTTATTALKVRVPGAPPPDPKQPYPAPAVPKGWKMNSILPYYSPALSGGGVSDNFFKDMMSEMGGQVPPGMASMMEGLQAAGGSGGSDKPKKIKRKIIRA
jgi:signal recognition particle subunit SRP19